MPHSHKKLRTFIAIPVPDAVKGFLKELQHRVKTSGINASWTRLETQHLTLAFMGDRTPHEIERMSRALEQTAETAEPFSLTAGGVGVFPSIKKARVIWCGIHGDIEHLFSVHQRLNHYLVEAGFDVENRRYTPHLTLARVKKPLAPKRLVQVIQECHGLNSELFDCSSIHLYASELQASGAVHTELCQARF